MDHTITHYTGETDEKKLNCLKFYLWAMENKINRYHDHDAALEW